MRVVGHTFDAYFLIAHLSLEATRVLRHAGRHGSTRTTIGLFPFLFLVGIFVWWAVHVPSVFLCFVQKLACYLRTCSRIFWDTRHATYFLIQCYIGQLFSRLRNTATIKPYVTRPLALGVPERRNFSLFTRCQAASQLFPNLG